MANTEKITRSMALAIAIDSVTDENVREVLGKIKASVEKKSASKPRALSEDKVQVRDEILRVLGDSTVPMSISDTRAVSEVLAPLNSSKISGNLTPMLRNGKHENPDGVIIRSVSGKTAVFSLA